MIKNDDDRLCMANYISCVVKIEEEEEEEEVREPLLSVKITGFTFDQLASRRDVKWR